VSPFTHNFGQEESEYLIIDKRGPWASGELTVGLAKAIALHLGIRLLVSE
jgi:hypothetical protein